MNVGAAFELTSLSRCADGGASGAGVQENRLRLPCTAEDLPDEAPCNLAEVRCSERLDTGHLRTFARIALRHDGSLGALPVPPVVEQGTARFAHLAEQRGQ